MSGLCGLCLGGWVAGFLGFVAWVWVVGWLGDFLAGWLVILGWLARTELKASHALAQVEPFTLQSIRALLKRFV